MALALVLFVVVVGPGVARAQAAPFDPNQIVFPVVGGPVSFIDDFYQPRSGGRTHGATDIMTGGIKGWPVVAAADGAVTWIGSTCCYLGIDHGGGYETWYIHLNNDTPGTDDGLGWGIAPSIADGTPVSQGQLIGWVGDSGNAESIAPHLHFEIRLNGVPIDPYFYLLAAPHLNEPGGVAVAPTANTFTDDDGNPHEANIEILFAHGITVGCGPGRYCPEDSITRGQMALFIYRQLGLPLPDFDFYNDDNGSIYEEAANAVTAAGIGFGCGERSFCEEEPLMRDEMAELLARTFGVAGVGLDYFIDDEASPFQASINAIKAVAITIGCDPANPDLFCPDRALTRGEMATFFVRAMGF